MKVFLFHEVSSQQWFSEVIKLLKRKYNVISIDEFHKNALEGTFNTNDCVITFDDGHKSFYTTVWPIVQGEQVPVTLFVSPKIISTGANYWFQNIRLSEKRKLLDKLTHYYDLPHDSLSSYRLSSLLKNLPYYHLEKIFNDHTIFVKRSQGPMNINTSEMLEMSQSPLLTLGAHTMCHPILANESDEKSKSEISESVKMLSELLGKTIKYFAYPNGTPGLDYSSREIQNLKNSGVKMAFTTEYKNVNNSVDYFQIPRFEISQGSIGKLKVKLMLLKYWDYLVRKLTSTETSERIRLKVHLRSLA